jgi:hypothetical protein
MACKTKRDDKMRSHYDFSDGVRGKYAGRYEEGTNVVALAVDVAKVIPDSIALSEALRTPENGGPTKRPPKKRRQ